MLLSTKIKVKISQRNKNIYLNKGYSNSIVGNEIDVNVDHLLNQSGNKVDVNCDYCAEIYSVRYCDYMRTQHEFLHKDACKKCWHKKRQDILQYKLDNNLLESNDKRGYWSDIVNVKSELKIYIDVNGHTGKGSNKEQDDKWNMIHWALKKHNIKLDKVVFDLGYNLDDLQRRKPNGYIIPLNELKEKIDSFVNEHGFFPDQKNLANDLKIYNSDYLKHGTLAELRDKFGYNDKKYLVDNRGFINKSSFELIVANYLIAQNLPYKREQFPFRVFDKSLNYRSDFTFYLPDKEIHLEVWGGMKTFKGQRELYDYDAVMKEKIRLYKKYDIELISVTPNIFYNSMGTIKKKLYDILSPYLNLPFMEVKDRLVSTFTLHEMSDENLLIELMKFSDRDGVLPATDKLRKNKHEFLYIEVLKRYDSYRHFANNFNLKLSYDFRNKKLS